MNNREGKAQMRIREPGDLLLSFRTVPPGGMYRKAGVNTVRPFSPLSSLPRPYRTAEAYHPTFARLLRSCPPRFHALQAARLALLPPPEQEDVIARNGHALFLKLTPSLPPTHRERGAMLEEAFRPLLLTATEYLEAMPSFTLDMASEAAQQIVQAYVAVHWTRGAQAAAMALYNAPT